MGKFYQCLTELSAYDMIMAGYYYILRFVLIMLNANRLKVKSGPVTSELQASLSATVAQLVEHLLCDWKLWVQTTT